MEYAAAGTRPPAFPKTRHNRLVPNLQGARIGAARYYAMSGSHPPDRSRCVTSASPGRGRHLGQHQASQPTPPWPPSTSWAFVPADSGMRRVATTPCRTKPIPIHFCRHFASARQSCVVASPVPLEPSSARTGLPAIARPGAALLVLCLPNVPRRKGRATWLGIHITTGFHLG